MAFDAGAILGKLGLDASEFVAGIEHGTEEAEHGSEQIRETMMAVADAVAEAFGSPAVSQIAVFAEQLLSGPLGAIEAFGNAIGGIREVVGEVGNAAAEAGFAAEKAGVSVEYFSRLSNVAKTVGLSSEQLGTGFKLLARNAEQALEGNKKLEEGFGAVGISTDFLRAHLDDMRGLFEGVVAGMDKLENRGQRMAAAQQLLGRSGNELIPLMLLGQETIGNLGDEFQRLGAVEDEESARTGRSFKVLTVEADAAWEGIKRAFAEPILSYLVEHEAEIKADVQNISQTIRDNIPEALEKAKDLLVEIQPEVQKIWGDFKDLVDFAEKWGSRLQNARTFITGGSTFTGDTYTPPTGDTNFNFNFDDPKSVDRQIDRAVDQVKRHIREREERAKGAAQQRAAAVSTGTEADSF